MFTSIGRKIKNQDGSLLVASVIMSLLIVTLGVAYLKFVDQYRLRVSHDVYLMAGLGGTTRGMKQGMLDHPQGGPDTYGPRERWYDTRQGSEIDFRYVLKQGNEEDGGYSQTIQYTMWGEGYVRVPGSDEDYFFNVGMRSSSFSFADWLYITERETQSYRRPDPDSILRFWGPDTLDGKVHSNDKLHFQQGQGSWPVFYEIVTSCSTRFDPVNAPQVVHFYGRYKLRAGRIEIPVFADEVRQYGFAYGQQFGSAQDSITELTLEPEGFYVRKRGNSGNLNRRTQAKFTFENYGDINDQPLHPYPATGALFIDGEVWITAAKGERHYNVSAAGDSLWLSGFSGQLTIGASGDIIIAQSVKYVSSNPDGTVPPTSRDALGLISEKHILVWRNCSAAGVTVQAALAAVGFGVSDSLESKRCSNNLMPKDGTNGTISMDGINCIGQSYVKTQLKILGCVIQRERGLIHTTYVSGERGFVSKKYRYDWRFRTNPPPHFFRTNAAPDMFVYDNIENIF